MDARQPQRSAYGDSVAEQAVVSRPEIRMQIDGTLPGKRVADMPGGNAGNWVMT